MEIRGKPIELTVEVICPMCGTPNTLSYPKRPGAKKYVIRCWNCKKDFKTWE